MYRGKVLEDTFLSPWPGSSSPWHWTQSLQVLENVLWRVKKSAFRLRLPGSILRTKGGTGWIAA